MTELTRGDIRTAVAAMTGDLRPLKATAAGSFNTFRDDRNLLEEDNGYAGCDIVFTGPTVGIQGESRYVSSSDFASSTLTFRPALSLPVPIDETAHLINYRGMGCTFDEYNQFINNAILYAQNFALVRQEGVVGTFTYTDPGWTLYDAPFQQSLPVSESIFRYLTSIYYVKDGYTYYPDRGSPGQKDGWWIDGPRKRIVIEGCLPSLMDGATVYGVGYGPPQPLFDDADPIDIEPEWMYSKVKAMVYGRMVEKGLADKRSDAALNEGLSQNAERQLRPAQFPPNTVRIGF